MKIPKIKWIPFDSNNPPANLNPDETFLIFLRETVNTIIDGKVVKVYKDEIEKQLYKELYSHFDLKFGG